MTRSEVLQLMEVTDDINSEVTEDSIDNLVKEANDLCDELTKED